MNDQTKERVREGQSPSANDKYKVVPPSRANQAAGALLLIGLFGIYWIYGFAGQIRNAATSGSPTTGLAFSSPTPPTQTLLGNLYILASIFVVIGFGLLLSYFKKFTVSALFIVIFTVSFTAILSPILQKFWFNVFITDFKGTQPATTDPARFLKYSLGGIDVYLDYYNLRIALANCIAQLVVLLGVFGRLNPVQLIINSLLYNFLWTFNYFLCVFLATYSPDSRIADDYQITTVYLFAATYGLLLSLLLPETKKTDDFKSSPRSQVLAQLGTFFLFLAFATTAPMNTLKYFFVTKEFERSYIWQEGFISIFIAMSASIISLYSVSLLLNPFGKFGIRGSLIGTLSGAIMWGSVAGTSFNIGAAITIGLSAGAISAVYFEKFYKKVNETTVRDSFGLGSIWIVAFLGTFFITPIVLKTYYNYSVDLPTLYPQNSPPGTYFISNLDVAGWALVYVGVSLAISLLGGLAIGLLLRGLSSPNSKPFDDSEFFKASSFGLRTASSSSTSNANPLQQVTPVSAQNLAQ